MRFWKRQAKNCSVLGRVGILSLRRIIEDLDLAISLLQFQGEGAAVLGRINKEAALHLKTRVGLYEGSWERYHGAKSTPFAVSGSDGTVFLERRGRCR